MFYMTDLFSDDHIGWYLPSTSDQILFLEIRLSSILSMCWYWVALICVSPQGSTRASGVSEGVKDSVAGRGNLILIRGPQPKYLSCKLTMVVPHWESWEGRRGVHNSFLLTWPDEGRLSRLILMYLHLETKTSFLSDDMEQISRWKIMPWLSGWICIFLFRKRNLT